MVKNELRVFFPRNDKKHYGTSQQFHLRCKEEWSTSGSDGTVVGKNKHV